MAQDLRTRLRELVTTRHEGRVARAARAWGVAQPTLHRFLAEKTSTVKVDVVRRAAEYERVSTDWLLHGTGQPPDAFSPPQAAHARWDRLVASLRLTPEVARAVLLLPNQIQSAAHYLSWHGSMAYMENNVSYRVATEAARGANVGATLELEAWSALLTGLIKAYGTEALADKLTAEIDLVRLGFKPFSAQLLWSNRIRDLSEAFADYAPIGAPHTTTRPPTTPLAPPLERPRIQQGRGKASTAGPRPARRRTPR